MFTDLPSLLNFYKLHYLDTTPLIRPAPKRVEKVVGKYDFDGSVSNILQWETGFCFIKTFKLGGWIPTVPWNLYYCTTGLVIKVNTLLGYYQPPVAFSTLIFQNFEKANYRGWCEETVGFKSNKS